MCAYLAIYCQKNPKTANVKSFRCFQCCLVSFSHQNARFHNSSSAVGPSSGFLGRFRCAPTSCDMRTASPICDHIPCGISLVWAKKTYSCFRVMIVSKEYIGVYTRSLGLTACIWSSYKLVRWYRDLRSILTCSNHLHPADRGDSAASTRGSSEYRAPCAHTRSSVAPNMELVLWRPSETDFSKVGRCKRGMKAFMWMK